MHQGSPFWQITRLVFSTTADIIWLRQKIQIVINVEILFLWSRLNDNHPFHQEFFSSTESAVGFFKSFRSSNLEYVYHHTHKANDSVCNWPTVQILHQADRIKVLKKEIWWDKILVGTGIWTRALPTRVFLSEHCFHYSDLHLPDWSTNLLLTYSLWPLGEQAKVTKTAVIVPIPHTEGQDSYSLI